MNRMSKVFVFLPIMIFSTCFTGDHYDPVTSAIDVNQTIPTDDLEWMEQTVYQCAEENDIPAMVVGIIYQGALAGYVQSGYFSRKSDQRVTPLTQFQIASLSKMFTGLIANNLIQEGLLDAQAPITNYLPKSLSTAAQKKLAQTKIADLLHHQSGFPWDAKYAKRIPFGGPMYGHYSEADLLKDLEELDINQDQVGRFSYSNLGYGTLGYIFQRITGQEYEQLLQQYISQPHTLSHTTTEPEPTSLATPYRPEWKRVKTKPWKMGLLRAGGGVFSSVEDLSNLMVKQMAIFKEGQNGHVLNSMREKRSSWDGAFYGYGMFETPARVDTTTQAFWHTGDVDGFASLYSFVPKHDIGIVILTSRGKSWMGGLEAKLKERLIKIKRESTLAKR